MKSKTWCKFPLVEVTWHDAAGETGWQDLYEAQQANLVVCITTGYLIKKDRRKVVIASSLNASTRVEHTTTIPRTWVVEIVFLQKVSV